MSPVSVFRAVPHWHCLLSLCSPQPVALSTVSLLPTLFLLSPVSINPQACCSFPCLSAVLHWCFLLSLCPPMLLFPCLSGPHWCYILSLCSTSMLLVLLCLWCLPTGAVYFLYIPPACSSCLSDAHSTVVLPLVSILTKACMFLLLLSLCLFLFPSDAFNFRTDFSCASVHVWRHPFVRPLLSPPPSGNCTWINAHGNGLPAPHVLMTG